MYMYTHIYAIHSIYIIHYIYDNIIYVIIYINEGNISSSRVEMEIQCSFWSAKQDIEGGMFGNGSLG